MIDESRVYSSKELAHATGATERQIQYWSETGILMPNKTTWSGVRNFKFDWAEERFVKVILCLKAVYGKSVKVRPIKPVFLREQYLLFTGVKLTKRIARPKLICATDDTKVLYAAARASKGPVVLCDLGL